MLDCMVADAPTIDDRGWRMAWRLLAVRAFGILLVGLCLHALLDVSARIYEGLQWAQDQKHPSGLLYTTLDRVLARCTLDDGVALGAGLVGFVLGVVLMIPASGNRVCTALRRWT